MVDNNILDVTAAEESNTLKQAACHLCRRSKVRCIRPPNATTCEKCAGAGVECVVPEYHVGRYKGVKNKRSGLDKAIHQVEEAVKKARTKGTVMQDEHTRALRQLLSVSESTPRTSADRTEDHSHDIAIPHGTPIPASDYFPITSQEHTRINSIISTSSDRLMNDDDVVNDNNGDVTVNNANNPLQLLAIASAIPEPEVDNPEIEANNNDLSPSVTTGTVDDDDTREFFGPMASKLDVGKDLDPVDLGLVSEDEVEALFEYFHDRLAHTRWGLDRVIHSSRFVRSRSAFLFTSIMSCAALFLPHTASLSTRLGNHCKLLARQMVLGGFRSLEIVLAYMLNIPWMQPGKTWATDDETCHYISTAMTIAIDLSLNKIVSLSASGRVQEGMEKIAQADCIEPRRALNMDCHVDIDPSSVLGKRLLRARERTWLALFNLDRGVCLARGRPWTVPAGPLVETCDTWHISDIADPWDGNLAAAVVLRRDFGILVADVRATCDAYQFDTSDSSNIVRLMREKIEGFFTKWYQTWTYQIQKSDGALPPYVEIIVAHGRLSAYCHVINHPTASMGVKQFFRAAGLTAALHVIRIAVQNESKLHSMPNNSVIMVSFAACFVLGLSTTKKQGRMYIADHVRASVDGAASALERIGSFPPHRKGASILFGRHIKRIMRQHTTTVDIDTVGRDRHSDKSTDASLNPTYTFGTAPYTLHSGFDDSRSTFPGFDSMTDEQLLDAIQNSREDIDLFNAGLQNENDPFMDWLDWPSWT